MKRVQRSRAKGSRLPPNTKCVTRPGKWSNPFTPEEDPGFQQYQVHLDARLMAGALDLDDLRGFDALACWCKPGAPCHADILVAMLDATMPDADTVVWRWPDDEYPQYASRKFFEGYASDYAGG